MSWRLDPSPDALLCDHLVRSLGVEGAHKAVDALVGRFTNIELAALAAHWPSWARPKQIAPPGDWVSWGFLTGRGFGKTLSVAAHITDEVQAGRVKCMGMAAQNELKTIAVQVGALLEAAPPWFKPHWEISSMSLTWPNGAVALAYTPEAPDPIRSPNFDLAWLSELQSWPATTREEAYSNFVFATRVGYARTIWDATPKKGHPILKRLLAMAAADPAHHVVVRGTIYENPHITPAALAKMRAEYAGTAKGREELDGEMLEESENSLVMQLWIDDARRGMPDEIVRRVISVDPAITTRAGSDRTAILDAGLGVDGQMLVLGDRTGKHKPDVWAGIVLDLYVRGRADLVIVETNRGGDFVAQNLRAAADKRGLRVVVVGKDERPRHVPGVVNVKEVHARGPKEDRAQPLATAYERRRVSHVVGVDLRELEEVLTTWEPQAGKRSPDPLDALAHAATELLGLLDNKPDPRTGFSGILQAGKALTQPPTRGLNISTLLGGGRGGRI